MTKIIIIKSVNINGDEKIEQLEFICIVGGSTKWYI